MSTIAASSLEYRFCLSLKPSIEEKDKILFLRLLYINLYILITLPILTTPFRTKLLIVIRTPYLALSYINTNLLVII